MTQAFDMNKILLSNNYKAGLYCRLSRDDGNSESESMSIQNQRDMLIAYANEKDFEMPF